ncbi:hypothetical protein KA005_30245, partial [bacterium]|nr:hypothetical protein [bacterium]
MVGTSRSALTRIIGKTPPKTKPFRYLSGRGQPPADLSRDIDPTGFLKGSAWALDLEREGWRVTNLLEVWVKSG